MKFHETARIRFFFLDYSRNFNYSSLKGLKKSTVPFSPWIRKIRSERRIDIETKGRIVHEYLDYSPAGISMG